MINIPDFGAFVAKYDPDGRRSCMNTDPNLFMAVGSQGDRPGETELRIEEAKAVCRTCCVKEDCLEFALTTGDEFAVMGETTPAERKRLLQRRARGAAASN